MQIACRPALRIFDYLWQSHCDRVASVDALSLRRISALLPEHRADNSYLHAPGCRTSTCSATSAMARCQTWFRTSIPSTLGLVVSAGLLKDGWCALTTFSAEYLLVFLHSHWLSPRPCFDRASSSLDPCGTLVLHLSIRLVQSCSKPTSTGVVGGFRCRCDPARLAAL